MPTGAFRGVYAIPPTPFHDDGSIDETSLARCIEFCLNAGANGIVAPVVASEAAALLDDERMRVAELVTEQVRGRVPVVIGVSGASEPASVRFTRHAGSIGADAVITMPPGGGQARSEEILAFYTAVARAAAPLPVWIQHYPGLCGTSMAPELLAQLVTEVEGVDWLKEESVHAPQVMTRVRELAGDSLNGVMGGMGGRYLLNEAARGACGTMPACEVVDVHVRIWQALERGDREEARHVHTRLLPLLNFEAMYGCPVWKEVLVRRGVIASARTRIPEAAVLDARSQQELDRLLADLGDLLTV
ncbi:MAG TPA: dihydrodipicolinate synthase family protein [Thermomicrobiales bacterium]|nr:dihydrodipicolinate synthase family protein [Thermomicrobiales bacterium]